MSLNITNHLRNHHSVLGGLFCILIGGFFILPTSPHRIILYAVLICGLVQIYKNKSWANTVNLNNKLFICILVFLFYALVSNFWSNIEDTERFIQKTKPAIFISLFIIVGTSYLNNKKDIYKLWVETYVLSAAITATALIVINLEHIYNAYIHNDVWRINGFGRAENSNQAGLFYGIAFIILLFLKGKYIKILNNKYFRVACIISTSFIFFLALSRGAFFAFSSTLIFITILKAYFSDINKKIIIAPLISIILISVLVSFSFPHLITYMIERGTTGRFELWQLGFEQFLQRPLFGHGAGTKFYYELEFPTHVFVAGHLHNLYLAVLVHFGLVGLSLFLLIVGLTLSGLIKQTKDTNDYSILAIFVLGCIFGLVDLGGHYNSLSTSWMIFWIPALVAIAHQRTLTNP